MTVIDHRISNNMFHVGKSLANRIERFTALYQNPIDIDCNMANQALDEIEKIGEDVRTFVNATKTTLLPMSSKPSNYYRVLFIQDNAIKMTGVWSHEEYETRQNELRVLMVYPFDLYEDAMRMSIEDVDFNQVKL